MTQTITTKFINPTNRFGSRIKASCQAGSTMVAWDYSLGVEKNHRAAAQKLASTLGWDGTWYGGFDKNQNGCFVLIDEKFSMSFDIPKQVAA